MEPSLAMQVDRDNVLAARNLLLAEADRLDRVLRQTDRLEHGYGRCGDDPVSFDAARAFGERMERLFANCRRYNQQLRDSAAELEAVARTYGYTEDEIRVSVGLPGVAPIEVPLGPIDDHGR